MIPGTLLGLETSGGIGSVAVAVDGIVRARRVLPVAREHAARVLPAVSEALDEVGLGPDGLGGVVVGSGPGSYTGVRVAAATAKGLVYALGIPLWAVSSLRAGALAGIVLPDGGGTREDRVAPVPGPVAVLFDARGRRLFAGWYDRTDGAADPLRPDRFWTLDEVLADPELAAMPLCGDGAHRHRDELIARGRVVLPPPEGVPTADALLSVVLRGGAEPVADPGSWEPDYLRATGAERAVRRGGARPMG